MEEWLDLGTLKMEISRVMVMKDEEIDRQRKEEIEEQMSSGRGN